jgi:endonuclease/exonuclease/phosphatase family metal-dependent hydrolase
MRSKIIVKLVSYNIQYGIGLDGRFDLDRIADTVRSADIIALQEVTRNFARNGGADMVAALQDLLPEHFSVYGAGMDVDMGSAIENGRAVNRRLQFGNMVLSRFPIVSSRNLLLPRSLTYDALNLQRSALEALVAAPGGTLRVYSVHLDHVSSDERLAQIAELKARALAYPLEGGAVSGAVEFGFAEPPCPEDFVLMGDFNLEPESIEYRAMVGASDTEFGRKRRATHPLDAEALFGARPAGAYSWMDMQDSSRRKHLDYCFVSASLAPRVSACRTDTDAVGSDHFPVWLDLD